MSDPVRYLNSVFTHGGTELQCGQLFCNLFLAYIQGAKGHLGHLGETGTVGKTGPPGFVGQKGSRGTIGHVVKWNSNERDIYQSLLKSC